MKDIKWQIIKLLIDAGLSGRLSEELSVKIDAVYKEAHRQKRVEWGRKGGQARVLKGKEKLRVTDPAAYERYKTRQAKSHRKDKDLTS